MRILTSAVCDHAADTPDGKLDVHGIFHDLYAPGFPARQDRMTLVLSLEWDRSDAGRHSFRVDVRGPDRRPTLTVEGQSEVTPQPPGRPPPRTRLVMPLEDVVFPVPGRYEFEVRVKGNVMAGPTLHLVEVAEGGSGGPG
ncbi:MAG: hypothetical protein OXE96_04850 [Gemmatimonadetes bacterium]|nr:hypothetical protein [Gemmatimonadota bacterium]